MFALLALNFFFGSIPYVEDVEENEIIVTKHFDDALSVDKANFAHCFAAMSKDTYECRHSESREITFCMSTITGHTLTLDWQWFNADVYLDENKIARVHAITGHAASITWPSTPDALDHCSIEDNTAFVRGAKEE